MVNKIVLLAGVAAAVVVVGSGALDGIVGKAKDAADSIGGGGGSSSTTTTTNTIIDESGVATPTGEISLSDGIAKGKVISDPFPVGDGSLIVQTPIVDPRGISQKEQESLFRFRNEQVGRSLATDVAFFRKLQQQQLSQTSLGTSVILSESDIARVVSKQLSRRDVADISALDRRKSESATGFLKLSGTDTILLKRLEAERARLGVFDSASVQNPNFNLGLPSNASKADIELAIRQQNENKIRQSEIERQRIIKNTNIAVGQAIIDATGANTLAKQKQIFGGTLNISGDSVLNAKTIGRLQELGLI